MASAMLGSIPVPLERDHELQRIDELLDDVADTGRTVLVEAPAGIGETVLLVVSRGPAAAAADVGPCRTAGGRPTLPLLDDEEDAPR